MNTDFEIIESMRSTYHLFLDEMSSHLEFFDTACEDCLSARDEIELKNTLQDLSKKLASKFHLIKGGSGFLQLQTIQKTADRAEAWFKDGATQEFSASELKTKLFEAVTVLKAEEQSLRKLLSKP